MDNYNSQEPYRATKLWNEVILAFRTGMPLKKHRWRMRSYDDCFAASECISWLNCYLKNNANFGPDVTRLQTTQLLQKFLKCNVIESICFKTKNIEFCDNNQLYRFVQYSPIKSKNKISLQALLRTPLSSHNVNNFENCYKAEKNKPLWDSSAEIPRSIRTISKLNQKTPIFNDKCLRKNIPECHFVARHLSVEDIQNIWKAAVLKRLEFAIHPVKVQDVLDLKEINGHTIFHNVSRVGKSGVVTLIDKTDDIPHWVMSAMKCLVNWPNASGSGSCLPNYPGFEKDVFKVVRDFFVNSQISLVPPELYHLMVELCFSGEKLQVGIDHGVNSNQLPNLSVTSGAVNKVQKTSTPVAQNSSVLLAEINASMLMISNPFSSQSVEGRLLLNDPNAMWDYPSVCFETEFSEVKPVTRIVPNHSLVTCFTNTQLNVPSLNSRSASNFDTASTISACSRVSKTLSTAHSQDQSHDFLQANADDQFISAVEYHEGKDSESWDEGIFDVTFKHCSFDDLEYLESNNKKPNSHMLPSTLTLPREYKNRSGSQSKLNSFSRVKFNEDNIKSEIGNHSSQEYSQSCEDICSASNSAWTLISNPSAFNQQSEETQQANISNLRYPHWENGSDGVPNILKSSADCINLLPTESLPASKKHFYDVQSCVNNAFVEEVSLHECFENDEQKEKLRGHFQVLLLLLPPANRRQLHLLFRMINKVIKNNKLTFESKVPIRRFFLETFLPAIVDLNDKFMYDKTAACRMISFMLDECETLFQTPSSLKEDVEIRLADMRKGRIKYTLDDSCVLTYCELVSQQQYEEQKVSLSKQALVDLLESIVKDKSISEKERKKKLKLFKSNHPEIYAIRFPNMNDPLEGSKPKKALFTRFLNLRM